MLPQYLYIDKKLFQYLDMDNDDTFKRPQNLYIYRRALSANLDIERDIYTYEDLIAHGAKEPNSEQLLKLVL